MTRPRNNVVLLTVLLVYKKTDNALAEVENTVRKNPGNAVFMQNLARALKGKNVKGKIK